ncbi:hypothetical protein GOODEAATRI_033743 [Goodea atripinnis]|uniref:Secreted protein n=1 Tax=Goodea atripinnis TaxID=208336 RepID=A0ABV0MXA1_9TELE
MYRFIFFLFFLLSYLPSFLLLSVEEDAFSLSPAPLPYLPCFTSVSCLRFLEPLFAYLPNSSTSPGSYVNMTLCSLCPLPSLRTSVDLLRTLWPVDEHSNVPSRTMASVTVLHGLTCTHTHMLKINICTPSHHLHRSQHDVVL